MPEPESALDRRRRLFADVFADFDARGVGLRTADNLPREALYDRLAARSDADRSSRRDLGIMPPPHDTADLP